MRVYIYRYIYIYYHLVYSLQLCLTYQCHDYKIECYTCWMLDIIKDACVRAAPVNVQEYVRRFVFMRIAIAFLNDLKCFVIS